jgi:hypothetical protein
LVDAVDGVGRTAVDVRCVVVKDVQRMGIAARMAAAAVQMGS